LVDGGYRRDRVTWVAFAALFAFGVLNAGLGPALPYIRAHEGISYLAGVLHQVAFAIGGGLAGVLAARGTGGVGRTAAIRVGLGCAAVAWLAVGYGGVLAVTVAGAFVVSLAGTSALIRLWAVLADEHGEQRTVAMTEGEIVVSLAGIGAPLLVGALAATALGWQAAFLVGAVVTVAAVAATGAARMPVPVARPAAQAPLRVPPTLLIVVAIVALEFSLTFWLASYLGDDVGVARGLASALVSVLYVANLIGRLLASRLARRWSAERLLAATLALALAGMPLLLAATSGGVATAGLALIGTGIGAMFPLASSMHVAASPRGADSALGQVLGAAAIGQVLGPLAVAAIGQALDLRAGLLMLPVLCLAAGGALAVSVARS
jgi:MFS family permease